MILKWVGVLLFITSPLFAQKPLVVTTFSVIEDLVSQIGGDKILVHSLISTGSDPHTFEPQTQHIEKLKKADIIFANGVYFEPWLEKLVKISKTRAKTIYVSSKAEIRKVKVNFATVDDPHAWNSPLGILSYIQIISQSLVSHYPEHKEFFIQRSKEVSQSIRAIDAEFKLKFSQLPKTQRFILTTHDSVGYLASEYGFTSISTLGLTTVADFKTRDLSNLIEQIEKYNIKEIFTEKNHHQLLSQKLANKVKIKLGKVLYLDGLSDKKDPANTVQNMLRYNLESIYTNLKAHY